MAQAHLCPHDLLPLFVQPMNDSCYHLGKITKENNEIIEQNDKVMKNNGL